MTALELLEAIGTLEDALILGAREDRSRVARPWRRAVLIAAAIALALLLVGCTVAYVLSLQGLKMDQATYTVPAGEADPIERTYTTDVISLQGIRGTPGYQAAMEWSAFLEGYDQDKTLLHRADELGWFPPMEYMSYNCYTQEMVEEIDAICGKYGLELLGPVYDANGDVEGMLSQLGIDSILRADAVGQFLHYAGYFYRDGTFQLEGETTLIPDGKIWRATISYQYRCVMKTAFDGVYLAVGDIEDYDQWSYTLADGTTALLALNQRKGLVFVDRGDFFVTVNVVNPVDDWDPEDIRYMDRAALEAFADTFNFAYTPRRPDTSALEEPEWFDGEAAPTEDEECEDRDYRNILDYNYDLLKDSRIRYDGQTYVYLTPAGMVDWEEVVEPGSLRYDQDLSGNLSADCAYLDNAAVLAYYGGLSDGLLGITAYIPELGDNVSALYAPEGRTYPQEYEYQENSDGSITILKYRGGEEDVVVPAEIDGKPVTSLSGPGEGAFSNCAWVKSVTIPEGVTLVNDNTFYACIHLETVRLPASLTGIGNCAFNLCPALKALYFEGDAPAAGNYLFDYPWDSFTLYRRGEATGWDAEKWSACRIQVYEGDAQ